jgi:hypothetical protein
MNYLLLLLWLRLPVAPTSPPLVPLQIAEQFVAATAWPAMKDYLCCEVASQAKSQTLGQQIPARLRRTCQLVQQGPATAVVAVELGDSVSRRDFYLHFSKETDGWKLRAIRNLAMTHLGPPMVNLLTALPPAEVADYDRKHPDARHAFTVGNLRLWTSADADLMAHFEKHRTEFEALRRLVQAGRYFDTPAAGPDDAGEQAANAAPAVHALLRQLYLARVSPTVSSCCVP